MPAKTLMIQGTASSVGKSLLVTALCRICKNRGYSVAPFKSQNMSLNSFVTKQGHEMGRAQVSQAYAAGLEPSSLMNPILLKPCSNKKSQVIVNGKVSCSLSAKEYYATKEQFLPAVKHAFTELSLHHDIIIIEGAGSPAEINLMENDFVNMGMADIADAPVILIGDIDRGGVFASLYGTIKLLPQEHQDRIKGLIINKFRGDVSILSPGIATLESLVNKPVLGVLPYEKFAIDDEDSLTDRFSKSSTEGIRIVIPKLPRIANFTDFSVFDSFEDCSLTYIEDSTQLEQADLIILPGSKSTVDDLEWLITTGIAQGIKNASQKGVPVIGICGGFQMLGKVIHDIYATESSVQCIEGLGLLDIETFFEKEKYTAHTSHTLIRPFGLLEGVGSVSLEGYEIHMGHSEYGKTAIPLAYCKDTGDTQEHLQASEKNSSYSGAFNEQGTVLGTYLHGIFDNLQFTKQLLANIRNLSQRVYSSSHTENKRTQNHDANDVKSTHQNMPEYNRHAGNFLQFNQYKQLQEQEYERLASMIEKYVDIEALLQCAGLSSKKQ